MAAAVVSGDGIVVEVEVFRLAPAVRVVEIGQVEALCMLHMPLDAESHSTSTPTAAVCTFASSPCIQT